MRKVYSKLSPPFSVAEVSYDWDAEKGRVILDRAAFEQLPARSKRSWDPDLDGLGPGLEVDGALDLYFLTISLEKAYKLRIQTGWRKRMWTDMKNHGMFPGAREPEGDFT